MKLLWTTASRNALEEIKKRVIAQSTTKDSTRIKIKFTKKKTFLAIPHYFFDGPAFNFYVNEKYCRTYLLKKKKWIEL